MAFFIDRRRSVRAAGALLALSGLAACGTRTVIPRLQPAEVAAFNANSSYPHSKYHIEPGDILQIRYTFHSERDQKVTVRPDGKIRASGIGDVAAAGLTTPELEKVLVERSSDRLRDPEVIVAVANFAPKTVYVAGEVGKPGPIVYRKGLTPLQAVSEAGGFLDTAHAGEVVLVRAVTADGKTVSRTLDLEEVMERGVPEPIDLAPHDVLFIPRSTVAEADVWVDQHFTQLFPFFKGAGAKIGGGK